MLFSVSFVSCFIIISKCIIYYIRNKNLSGEKTFEPRRKKIIQYINIIILLYIDKKKMFIKQN